MAQSTLDCVVIGMMGWNFDGGAWLGLGFGMLVWLVVAVVVVWLIVRDLIALDRTLTGTDVGSRQDEILRERIARGEIDPDGFQRRPTRMLPA